MHYFCNSAPVGKEAKRYIVLHIFRHSVAYKLLVKFKHDLQLFEQICKWTLQLKIIEFGSNIVHQENVHRIR